MDPLVNIGVNWGVFGQQSFVFRHNWSVLGQNCFVFGQNWFGLGQNCSAFGQNQFVFRHNWFVLGQNYFVFGRNWIVFGQNLVVSGQNCFVFGQTGLSLNGLYWHPPWAVGFSVTSQVASICQGRCAHTGTVWFGGSVHPPDLDSTIYLAHRYSLVWRVSTPSRSRQYNIFSTLVQFGLEGQYILQI